MRRRDFIASLGSATAWPLAAHAQQVRRLPIIGFLSTTTPSATGSWITALEQRLRELGWIKGRTIAIEYRWAEGHPDRYPEFAAEFVRLKVDVIVTTVPAVPALKQATSVIPIVFALATDPVGGGLVASLARPGGNVTGLSMQATDLAGKRVALLHDIIPRLKRLAVLGNITIPQVVLEMREIEAASSKLNLQVVPLEIHRAEDIAPAFKALKDRAEALYVCADPLSVINRVQISSLALDARLPTIYGVREGVEVGGLMSYGTSFADQFRHTADLVDKILRGTKPGEARMEESAECMLVLIGATPEGKKELVGLQTGVRESAQSWRELLIDIKRRGLEIAPDLAVGDGALGFRKAIDEVFPGTRHQRCWVHKTANVLNKVALSVQVNMKADLREIYGAPTRATAEFAIDVFAEKYGAKYEKAVACLTKDREALLAFFDFPAEHWDHLRTSNPIESVFATVRHRTVRTKGSLSAMTARLMVFKLVTAAAKTWRRLKGENQLPKVVQGVRFQNGIEVIQMPAHNAA
jgi:ABC-type uncharacterized transport system substrate-binding protein